MNNIQKSKIILINKCSNHLKKMKNLINYYIKGKLRHTLNLIGKEVIIIQSYNLRKKKFHNITDHQEYFTQIIDYYLLIKSLKMKQIIIFGILSKLNQII